MLYLQKRVVSSSKPAVIGLGIWVLALCLSPAASASQRPVRTAKSHGPVLVSRASKPKPLTTHKRDTTAAAALKNAHTKPVFTLKPLAGLKGVAVVIEDISQDAQADGLDGKVLQTDAELSLRKAGITVFEKYSSSGNDTEAYLYINVDTLKNGDGLYAFSIAVYLNEKVRLLRDSPSPIITSAETWKGGNVGFVGQVDMATFIREKVSDDVDVFANDFLAQNPKI